MYCIHLSTPGMALTGMKVPDISNCGVKTRGPIAPVSRGNLTKQPINNENATLQVHSRQTVNHMMRKEPCKRIIRCEIERARNA
mmetsp:Transcript_66664/g.124469  ORF Transcript_66664/g.124469 Transcript_66664/m.124469 type:complete len:84 (+) Transcript_66664:267-518(+)